MLVRPLCCHRRQPGEAIWGIPANLGLIYLAVGLAAASLVRRSPYTAASLDQMDESAGSVRALKPVQTRFW